MPNPIDIKGLVLHNRAAGKPDFHDTAPLTADTIKSIKDPDGDAHEKTPTSVPSPFAQMDLVRAAFQNIIAPDNESFGGSNMDFKLVSGCFDVGEVFFNYERYKNDLRLVTWHRNNDLDALLNSSTAGHKRLGKALELFLEQDAATFNFAEMDSLTMLYYKNGIIGGLSPATLFYASANDLSFAKIEMTTDDVLFDNDYDHLYDRDAEYQLFWYALEKAMPDFRHKFRAIANYLRINLSILQTKNPTLYGRIIEMKAHKGEFTYYADAFETVNTQDGKVVSLLDFAIRRRKGTGIADPKDVKNDYRIATTVLPDEENLPMVLRHNHEGKSRTGARLECPFKIDFEGVPHHSLEDVVTREVPGVTSVRAPYFVISDFLEPYLMRMVYPIDTKRYFDGNNKNKKSEKGYLVPIKPLFFKYFTTNDLMGQVKGGKNMLDIEVISAVSVRVTLRVPIHGGESFTEYQRDYITTNFTDIKTPDETQNQGVLVENQFGLTIFPFLKTPAGLNADYRVLTVDRDIQGHTQSNAYNLAFYKNGSTGRLEATAKRERTQKKALVGETISVYVQQQNFDFLRVSNGIANGIIIPKMEDKSGTTKFRFAIDFGTTNTHIEYATGTAAPKALDITDADLQIGCLHDAAFKARDSSINGTNALSIFDAVKFFFHEKISDKGRFRFPQRTALMEDKKLDFGKTMFALSDFNIPFYYERYPEKGYAKVTTNLKWSDFDGTDVAPQKRVEAYLEHLLFMLRAKVLLNGGDIEATEITWFYPYSMTVGKVDKLEETWQTMSHKYFSAAVTPRKVSESLAPFFFFNKTTELKANTNTAACIDIGGGTSDIVVFNENSPVLLSSFRFAANSIFGDAFTEYGGALKNGFVRRYSEKVNELLTKNNLSELKVVSDSIASSEQSADIVAFFFSLENNYVIADKGITVSDTLPYKLSGLLENDSQLKLVFVVFYTALIYHIATLLKAKSIAQPRFISFSGNGSKVLNYITRNDTTLSNLTKIIIEKVYGTPYNSDGLNIVRTTSQPKEVTCKGGLMMQNDPFGNMDFDDLKAVLLGTEQPILTTDTAGFKTQFPTGTAAEPKKTVLYGAITSAVKQSVKKEVENFIDILFEIHEVFSFEDKLNVTFTKDIADLKADLKKDLIDGIDSGLEAHKNLTQPVAETLFFYPITQMLNRLANNIVP
jgi:hypothetical protein